MGHGQVSVEYLSILGITLLLLAPLGVIVNEYLNYSDDQISEQQLVEISRTIVDTSQTVFFLGYPTKIKLKIYFPNHITSAQVLNHGISFLMKGSSSEKDFYEYSPVNLTGNLTTNSGLHYVLIQALPEQVNISVIT